MSMFKRFGFFILTNLLVVVTIGIVWSLVSTFLLGGVTDQMTYLLIFSAVFGMTGAFVSLLISRWMAKKMYRVQVIDPKTQDPQLQWLVTKVHEYSRRAHLPAMPEVGIYDSPEVNAFATGPSKKKSLVAVSSGLLQRMTREEAEAVIGHEVAHVANGDMVTMTLIQGVVNTFAIFFSRLLASVIAANVEERNRPMVQFAVTIIGDIAFTLLGSMVVAWFSRQREFRADKGGAKLAGRDNMVAALQRLQSLSGLQMQVEDEKDAMAALKISHIKRGGVASLFHTHPPLEVRIKALLSARVG